MGEREKLAYASTMAADEAAQHLEALARGLREHVMIIESGDTSIAIDVAREVRLELEAGAGEKKSELEIKIVWRAEEGTELQPPVLKILPRDPFAAFPKNGANGHDESADFGDEFVASAAMEPPARAKKPAATRATTTIRGTTARPKMTTKSPKTKSRTAKRARRTR